MRLERASNGDLIVTNREMFVRVLLVAFIVLLVVLWLTPMPLAKRLGWSALFLVFGLALLAADERSTFVFDAKQGVLTWRKETRFRRVAGEIPLSSITALSMERHFTSSGQRGAAKRLVLLTTKGPLPVTQAFSGFDRTQEPIGRAVQQFLNGRQSGESIPFITD